MSPTLRPQAFSKAWGLMCFQNSEPWMVPVKLGGPPPAWNGRVTLKSLETRPQPTSRTNPSSRVIPQPTLRRGMRVNSRSWGLAYQQGAPQFLHAEPLLRGKRDHLGHRELAGDLVDLLLTPGAGA